jgi:hypothetical protein
MFLAGRHVIQQAAFNFISVLLILFRAGNSVLQVCFQLRELVAIDVDVCFLVLAVRFFLSPGQKGRNHER